MAGVNLEERVTRTFLSCYSNFLMQVVRIRSRAPRVAKATAKEEVSSERPTKVKSESGDAKVSEDGERPIRKKKSKGKLSSYNKKPSAFLNKV